jgi:pteridine reductase
MGTKRLRNSSKKPVALVTGSAGSIGRVICLKLAQSGFDLALHGRVVRPMLKSLAHEIESAGAQTKIYAVDLSRPATTAQFVKSVTGYFGRLDLLVNSASEFFPTPCGGRPSDWDRLFRTNAVSPYFLSRAAALSLARSHGSIVNLIDVYAEYPFLSNHPAYLASKAALSAVTQVLARELAPFVRVNGVSPGAVTFPNTYSKAERQKVVERSLLKKEGSAEDVADAVMYLAGASFVTGQVIRVDGGRFI